MNTKMFLFIQIRQDCVWYAPIANLDGVSILDKACNIPPETLNNLVRHCCFKLQQWFVMRKKKMYILYMYEGISMHTGHM